MSMQGCPGSRMFDFRQQEDEAQEAGAQQSVPSQLRQWPVQLHLVSPHAPYFEGGDVLLAADCVAFSMGNFHSKYLKGNNQKS